LKALIERCEEEIMAVSLGPLPVHLQELLRRWIADQPERSWERLAVRDGLLLHDGVECSCWLSPTGDLIRWHELDNVVTKVDGPEKVRLVCEAIHHRPQLADWLPPRPTLARDCELCNSGGWLLPPLPRTVCSLCSGLGWLPVEMG
jgi:hypothetical protein